MDAVQISIKINQTKQSDGGKQKSNILTEAPTIPFNQILAMFNNPSQTSETEVQQAGETANKSLGKSNENPLDLLKLSSDGDDQTNSDLTVLAVPFYQGQPLAPMIVGDSNKAEPAVPEEGMLGQGTMENSNDWLQVVHTQGEAADLSKTSLSITDLAAENKTGDGLDKPQAGIENTNKEDIFAELLNKNVTQNIQEAGKGDFDQNRVQLAVDSFPEFVAQLSDLISQNLRSVNGANEKNSLTVLADLKSIGKINIEISSLPGPAALELTVDPASAKEMLQSQLQRLEQAVQQSGLVVKKIEIVDHPSAPFLEPTLSSNQADNTAEMNGPVNQGTLHSQTMGLNHKSMSGQPRPVLSIHDFTPEVSSWIAKNIGSSQGQNTAKEVKFLLSPEHLGQMEVKLTTTGGQVSAQIITDTIQAKEILSGQLHTLKQALQQQGLMLQKLEVIQQPAGILNQAQLNQSFSQGGFHSSPEHRSGQSAKNDAKKPKENGQMEIDMDTPLTTYQGAVQRTSSNIDFTA
ncbi:flagellar hook-length control protein FliK [Neobacillus sp. OS1-32]|uniref:flagellar hook-length control protein FliK n=1 Tax=Neobacillus sp. OS1-32 TaxID=3070682 RepID=UPI0027DF845A|nr:flagellar hook-length control protein FliK [Neobacillus sp. OS1-32]WML31568.1 flagellar hook-length control protein FliK [Neobacillus sp. OS1-32]